ncbi:FAD binding domain protein [Lasiosphaeria hispida]|uniref:FAD binding domain protein n=1 Tax=Lasiosphaeria hispida TaxID=260671 RepID=A0AAJ0HEH1_9PEZI|nr:FAD binding domain protein [Lasiosphaeria hispida]
MTDPAPILLRGSTDPTVFHDAVWDRVFNHRRDTSRVPLAFCAARTVADVVAAVEFAKTRGCRVSVRSGGHSWAAWSVRHEALLLDLADLDRDPGPRIEYDELTKVVSCSPSVTGQELNDFLIAVDGGTGRLGWACESITAIEVVTADSQKLHCSETSNPDLIWAARGAGPGFPAIVTRFHLLTRPLTQIYQSLYFFPLSAFRTILQWEIDLAPTADPDTEIVGVTSHFPIPSHSGPLLLANFTTFKPCLSAAEAALSPIHASLPVPPLLALFCQPSSLADQYAQQTAANPAAHRYCSDNVYLANHLSDIPARLEAVFAGLPTPKSAALWFSMNPVSRRAFGGRDMALSLQSDHYVALYAVWEAEAEDDKCRGWVRGVMEGLERDSVGSYLGDADFEVRRTRFWSEEAGAKLKEVRRVWDPEGRVCGFLDRGDGGGVEGLANEFEWGGE